MSDRFHHIFICPGDFERSLAFYRDLVGLTPLSHTKAVPQDGSGFGLSGRVQWDAHLLHDGRGLAGPGLDLLEWQQPRPIGHPARTANQLGLYRLCLAHPDLDALHARMTAAGVRTASEPVEMPLDHASGLRRRRPGQRRQHAPLVAAEVEALGVNLRHRPAHRFGEQRQAVREEGLDVHVVGQRLVHLQIVSNETDRQQPASLKQFVPAEKTCAS